MSFRSARTTHVLLGLFLALGGVQATALEDPAVTGRVQATLEALTDQPPRHLSEEPWSVSLTELELEFQPLALETVQERVAEWMQLLAEQVSTRNNTQVALDRALREATDTPPDEAYLAALNEHQTRAQERINQLGERINVGLALIERRGGSVEAQRGYINATRSLRQRVVEEESREADARRAAEAAMSDEERAAAEREVAMAAAIEGIRREPPVHERAEPWRVPLRELDLELQPLQNATIKERADIWSQMLEQRVRERNRLLLAADRPDNQLIARGLASQANEVEGVIIALVDRLEVILRMLEKRGEETGAYRQYISDVTGIKLNLTDIRVLGAQVWAWMVSETGGIRWAIRISMFLFTLFAAWFIGRMVGMAIHAAMSRLSKGASSILRDMVVGIVRKVIMLIGIVLALGVIGVNVTPLVAAIGAAGLVIGLALQGTLSNFASGILILINKPFELGDAINAGGVTGKVDGLSLVSTRILTFDNQIMYVPNNQIWNGVITNLTGLKTRRVDLTFGIGYKDDMAKAEAIIGDVISRHPKTLKDPAPTIKVHELGDSSVNFIARPWAATTDYWDVYWDITRQVKERFDAEGVGIPFPQRDLHVPGQIEVVLGERRVSTSVLPAASPAAKTATGGSRGEPGPAEPDETN